MQQKTLFKIPKNPIWPPLEALIIDYFKILKSMCFYGIYGQDLFNFHCACYTYLDNSNSYLKFSQI